MNKREGKGGFDASEENGGKRKENMETGRRPIAGRMPFEQKCGWADRLCRKNEKTEPQGKQAEAKATQKRGKQIPARKKRRRSRYLSLRV